MTPDFVAAGTSVSMPSQTSIRERLRMFLGHYDLRVYVSEAGYVDLGRGSFDGARKLAYVQQSFAGCLGTAGQFCDFADTCVLLAGGEHRNASPINVTFSNVPAFHVIAAKHQVTDFRVKQLQPFAIGHAVVLSADTRVLSGARVGDGTLLAAAGVAVGELEPFSVYGGVPATKRKDRVDKATRAAMARVRWWDFDTAYIGNNLARLQALASDDSAPHVYRQPTPRFVLKMLNPKDEKSDVQVLGFLQGTDLRPLSDAPQAVRDYVMQLAGPGPYRWMPNVWES